MGYVEYTPYRQRVTFEQDFKPIPKTSVEGWKNIPIVESPESHDKLVPIGPFSPYFSDCDTSAVYFGERGEGESINFVGHPVDRKVSLITHFVREGLVDRIRFVQSVLPVGIFPKFFDTARPKEVQQALFDAYFERLQKEHPNYSKEQLEELTQTYVSLPSPDPKRGTTHPSPHSTGGVVDLTLIRLSDEGQQLLHDLNVRKLEGKLSYPISKAEKAVYDSVNSWVDAEAKRKKWSKTYRDYVRTHWLSQYRYFKEKAEIFHTHSQELDMGTPFDYFGPEAGTRYYEELCLQRDLNIKEKEILQNRRLFYHVMTLAGFANLKDEYWHWGIHDNMSAAITNQRVARYGVALLNDDNRTHEWVRRGILEDALSRSRNGQDQLFIPHPEADPSRN